MTYYLNIIDTTRKSIPHIDYYVHLQNLSTFKIDTKQIIKTIINSHCKPLSVEAISVKTYFRPTPFLLVANSTDIAGVVLESIFSMIIPCSPLLLSR